MNDVDYPEKPSGFLLGKQFIIVIVVVFSGLSFTLGYFVGRTSNSVAPGPSLQAAENSAVADSKEASQPQQSTAVTETDRSGFDSRQPLQATNQPLPATVTNTHMVKQEPERTQKQGPTAGVPGRISRAVPEKTTTERPAVAMKPVPPSDKQQITYAVQIGAFKSPADAKNLKAAFEKKGLMTQISTTTDAKGQKVYKVRTGEFREKKEAEVLALKLRKTEGLHTYVTNSVD